MPPLLSGMRALGCLEVDQACKAIFSPGSLVHGCLVTANLCTMLCMGVIVTGPDGSYWGCGCAARMGQAFPWSDLEVPSSV